MEIRKRPTIALTSVDLEALANLIVEDRDISQEQIIDICVKIGAERERSDRAHKSRLSGLRSRLSECLRRWSRHHADLSELRRTGKATAEQMRQLKFDQDFSSRLE